MNRNETMDDEDKTAKVREALAMTLAENAEPWGLGPRIVDAVLAVTEAEVLTWVEKTVALPMYVNPAPESYGEGVRDALRTVAKLMRSHHVNGLIERSSSGDADATAAGANFSDEKARGLVERPKRGTVTEVVSAAATARRVLERADEYARPSFPTEATEHLDAVSTALERLIIAIAKAEWEAAL